MGRTSIAKQRKISQLRNQGFTQQEVAQKLGLDIRTVRGYDPLRQQKPMESTVKQIEDRDGLFLEEVEQACDKMAAEGLLHIDRDGRVSLSYLGKKQSEELERLKEKAVLNFLEDAGRPVSRTELEGYLDEISEQLWDQALDNVKRRRG